MLSKTNNVASIELAPKDVPLTASAALPGTAAIATTPVSKAMPAGTRPATLRELHLLAQMYRGRSWSATRDVKMVGEYSKRQLESLLKAA